MTGHLIGQFQHPWVKVISVNTQHGHRHRIITKTFRERVSVGTMRMIAASSKYYDHWPMIFLRYPEHKIMTTGNLLETCTHKLNLVLRSMGLILNFS